MTYCLHNYEVCMSTAEQSNGNDLVDMELHCVTCGARLYLAVPQARAVIASLERTGAAILICVCGQAQLVRRRLHRKHD